MTSTPIGYDVVKVSELELIGRVLNGNDEIVVNDLLVAPVETKRCRVIDLANSIKQYVLPIASATELGGVKIGDGLTINPTSGVLTTDVVALNDLSDVSINTPSTNELVVYDGTNWVNTTVSQAFVEMSAGAGIEITGKGTSVETINVKAGGGIAIVNDGVTVNPGPGISIINDKVQVNAGNGLESNNNIISVAVVDPFYFTNSGDLALNYGSGFLISGGVLNLNPAIVPIKDANGNLTLPGNLTVQENVTISGSGTNTITGGLSVSGSVSLGGQVSITGNIVTQLSVLSDVFINGELNVTGDINTASDINLKDNIKTITGALHKINHIRGVSFDWKRDGKGSAGVIAQEVEKVIPSLVIGESQKSVNYNGLIGVLIEAVKELSKEVEELKNK